MLHVYSKIFEIKRTLLHDRLFDVDKIDDADAG